MANFCGTCGSPLGENSVFCGACGAKVQPDETPVVAPPIPSYHPVAPDGATPVSSYQPFTPDVAAPVSSYQPVTPDVAAPVSSYQSVTPIDAAPFSGYQPVTPVGAAPVSSYQPFTPVDAAPVSSYQPVTPVGAAPVSSYQSVTPLPAARTGMSPVIKIVLVVVVLLVLVGTVAMAGLYYVFHLAARKAHQISQQVRNGAIVASLPADEEASPAVTGPGACRLISKEDVGRAIGIAIVSTNTTANGCEYLAQGTPGDLRSKHIAAMMASNGANAQQQKMMQSLSKGLFGGAPPADGSNANTDVNSVVLAFTIAPNTSEAPLTGSPLPAVGEEATVTAGSVMSVRKRSKIIRINYSTCPCTTSAIVPLAKRLAASQ